MLEAQRIAVAHGVLSHDSPERAIAVFLGAVNYRRNRSLLLQMPPSLPEDFAPDRDAAHAAVGEALAVGEQSLTAGQARRLLHAYGISAAESPVLGSIAAAIHAAEAIGYPVDLLLAHAAEPVAALSLRSPAEIELAARALRRQARAQRPGCRVNGYRLRPSAARGGIPALRLGVAVDPVFGPVIFLGPASTTGGRAAAPSSRCRRST